jgi:hypothetical protein
MQKLNRKNAVDPEVALRSTKRIQGFLKLHNGATTRKIIEVFCGGGPTIEKVKSIR